MTEQEFIDSAVRDQAARAMLAALEEAMRFSRFDGEDQWADSTIKKCKAAIAAAKAAGIKAEG